MSRAPLVSCIVAAYNYERYVEAALRSALDQDYPEESLEIVVIDDGSTDATADIVKSLEAESDGRVRYVHQENGGLCGATTRGLHEARGELITLLDADDEWPRDRVRLLVDFMLDRPAVGLAYGDMEVIDEAGNTVHPSDLRRAGVEPRNGALLGALLKANFVSAPALMFRATFKDHVCPIPTVAPYQDWWFAARIAEVSEIGFLGATLARYRRHGSNLSEGAEGARVIDFLEKEIPFRRWMLATLKTETVSVEELVEAYAHLVGTAQEVARHRGRSLESLLAVEPEQVRRAEVEAVAGRRILASGDFPRAAASFVRALALDPWNEMARTGIDHAQRRFAVPLPAADPHQAVTDDRDKRLYCIKAGYAHRPAPEYFVDLVEERDGVVWQPEVYPEAARIARRLGSTRVIDIGPGSGSKLARLYPEFELIGLDFGPNLQMCRERYPFGSWRQHDLDTEDALPVSAEELRGSIVVCSDVIEHLVRPERLLSKLRVALDHADAILLSTPERDRTRGEGHFGPPPHFCHVREWNISELGELLGEWGFKHGDLGLTRSNNLHPGMDTILAVLYRDAEIDARASGTVAEAV
ncbi:MAG: hypothetical protein NVSMB25_17600 [Thermoleophilaceae bacterium]